MEDRSIGRVFITGVLPITIDDLTSGFNIAEIITLAPNMLSMLGFTQAEVNRYVETIFADKDQYTMTLPNQTMREIFTEYYNTLARIEVSAGYTPYFQQFLADLELGKLFAGYWEVYIGQLPAQLFDRMNENFFRTTFFELCSRYLARDFSFGVEVNHPSGRSDWEMLGKPDSRFANL